MEKFAERGIVGLGYLSLLFEEEDLACGSLYRLKVSFARGNSLVKEAHLHLTESLVEIETTVSTYEFPCNFLVLL